MFCEFCICRILLLFCVFSIFHIFGIGFLHRTVSHLSVLIQSIRFDGSIQLDPSPIAAPSNAGASAWFQSRRIAEHQKPAEQGGVLRRGFGAERRRSPGAH